MIPHIGISLYLQGTLNAYVGNVKLRRYIPVPTGNSLLTDMRAPISAVYPCTYRELKEVRRLTTINSGISLYLQGTRFLPIVLPLGNRYIPVPTGNSKLKKGRNRLKPVYPCTYRELLSKPPARAALIGISLYLQGTHALIVFICFTPRYIPVPTGNSSAATPVDLPHPVYPCTYRELPNTQIK